MQYYVSFVIQTNYILIDKNQTPAILRWLNIPTVFDLLPLQMLFIVLLLLPVNCAASLTVMFLCVLILQYYVSYLIQKNLFYKIIIVVLQFNYKQWHYKDSKNLL